MVIKRGDITGNVIKTKFNKDNKEVSSYRQ